SSSVPPQALLQTPTTAAADPLLATPKPQAEAGTTDQTTIYRSTVQQSHSSSQTVQNISPTVAPSAARKEGFLSKLLNAKQKSNERERINEGLSITPGL
ncbi:hypothetical protein IscW_ISCW018049, partial [Ixodes scapularis]